MTISSALEQLEDALGHLSLEFFCVTFAAHEHPVVAIMYGREMC
jgi:hypothetical protein